MSKRRDNVLYPTRPGTRKFLGDLESEIMEILWQKPEDEGVSVRDVYEVLRSRRPIAYTTVMTTMSRLVKKGLLRVDKGRQTYSYRPLSTKREFVARSVGRIIDSMLQDFPGPVLTHFVAQAEPGDKQEIERILAEIQRRRKQGES